MVIEKFNIEGIFSIAPIKRGDHRGFFSETYSKDALAAAGIVANFVQDNHVYSAKRGVLRGLHFQVPPRAQVKLIRCTRGAILDVNVDIRRGSPTMASTSLSSSRQRTGSSSGYPLASLMVTSPSKPIARSSTRLPIPGPRSVSADWLGTTRTSASIGGFPRPNSFWRTETARFRGSPKSKRLSATI